MKARQIAPVRYPDLERFADEQQHGEPLLDSDLYDPFGPIWYVMPDWAQRAQERAAKAAIEKELMDTARDAPPERAVPPPPCMVSPPVPNHHHPVTEPRSEPYRMPRWSEPPTHMSPGVPQACSPRLQDPQHQPSAARSAGSRAVGQRPVGHYPTTPPTAVRAVYVTAASPRRRGTSSPTHTTHIARSPRCVGSTGPVKSRRTATRSPGPSSTLPAMGGSW